MMIRNGEVYPFDEEPQLPNEMIVELDAELESLERRKAYILELKEFYENSGNNAADVQAAG